jgi:microcystin-dependent protein
MISPEDKAMKLSACMTALLLAAVSPCHAQITVPYFVGQILTFGFAFCPSGTVPANGQIMQISQNAALYSLLGTQYGGDGISTFALPNLKAPLSANRAPLHYCIATSGIFPSQN